MALKRQKVSPYMYIPVAPYRSNDLWMMMVYQQEGPTECKWTIESAERAMLNEARNIK